MSEEQDKVTLDKAEFEEIMEELERLSAKDDLDEDHEWMLTSTVFWDNFFTKVISNFVSVKVWILIFVLYIPYQLLKANLITADNYTSILIVVAPVVVGLREFSKAKVNGKSTEGLGLLDKAKKLFRI